MGWPTPQEYNEAIQNPASAFEDPELRAGLPLLTPLGLPRPITGAFASVYQLACPKARTVAVRCFLRDFSDNQDRYAAISAHLGRMRLPYMADFTYLANGIRVNGRWYPILKMDWLEGEALQTYVERNLHNPDALRSLAEQWVQMSKLLRSSAIGHGDLQHGNVIICGGQLRLIDYDGMYVPALAGKQSHEIGHRNYQHPQRSERDFGPGVDHFSTWVVYTSLVALSLEPQLWRDFGGGDECLIFRREDFERPANSRLFRSLQGAADPRLASLAAVFRSVTLQAPERVPPIDGPLPVAQNGTGPAVARASAPPADWLRDHVNNAPPVGQAPAGPAPAAAAAGTAAGAATAVAARRASPAATDPALAAKKAAKSPLQPTLADNQPTEPSWITDFVGGQQMAGVGFGGDLGQQRTALRTPLIVVVLTWIGFQAVGLTVAAPLTVTALAAVVAFTLLAGGYSRDPSILAWKSEQQALRTVEDRTRRTVRRLQVLQQKGSRAERKLHRRRQQLEAKRQQKQDEEKTALARHDQRLQEKLAEAQRRRDALRQAGVEAVRKLEAQQAAQLAALDQQIGGLHQAEEGELRQALERRQKQFVADYMKRQTIEVAVIAGIGPSVKQMLHKQGIVRAMDLDAGRLAQVEGIGDARARVLLEWRRKVEALAAQTAPQSLSLVDETLIRGKFFQRRFSLEQEKGKTRNRLARDVAAAQASNVEQLKAADQEPQRLRGQAAQKRDEIRKSSQQGRDKVQAELAAVAKAIADQQAGGDQEAAAVQMELALLNAEAAGIHYRLRRYEGLHFGSYLRRVVVGE